jgi:hypothetical protein
MKMSVFTTAMIAVVLGTQLAAAGCQTVYVNGQPRQICTPDPSPPPGTGCGVFCRPAPTR